MIRRIFIPSALNESVDRSFRYNISNSMAQSYIGSGRGDIFKSIGVKLIVGGIHVKAN